MAETLYKQTSLQQSLSPRLAWKTPAAAIAGSGFVALCAHIALPLGFTPVPLTMQTFAVLLVGLLLPPGAAFASLSLYLLEGAIGLPVFSGLSASGGLLHLIGPTGGYLLAYPFAAAMASGIYRYANRGILASWMAVLLANILILLVGATWLGMVSRITFSLILVQAVVPFLLGDAIKAAAAAICASAFDSVRGSSRD